jgi:hypothetical protein
MVDLTQPLVDGEYIVCNKVGGGSFGKVYRVE